MSADVIQLEQFRAKQSATRRASFIGRYGEEAAEPFVYVEGWFAFTPDNFKSFIAMLRESDCPQIADAMESGAEEFGEVS